MSEIKDPLQRCRERNRLLRRALFEWQEQAARIGNLIGCSSVDIVEHITKMHSDLSTANATISALEGKLAAAERLHDATRKVLGRWHHWQAYDDDGSIEALGDELEQAFKDFIALQKENTND